MRIFSFFVTALSLLFATAAFADKIDFWTTPQKGANVFNHKLDGSLFDAAREKRIPLLRIAFSKWDAEKRDFLIGNADAYKGIPPKDLESLLQKLDDANKRGIKVVVTPLSLPGARWRQQNGNKTDARLWKEPRFAEQAAAFWRDLAIKLKDHPAVVGYNILNEPYPEKSFGFGDFWSEDITAWYQKHRGTAADLNLFNQKMVAAIREVDPKTPIILDAGHWAMAPAFRYLEPVKDPNVLYALHMYEPFSYTNLPLNKGRYTYPGMIPSSEDKAHPRVTRWDRDALKSFLAPVREFQTKYNIPSNRIFASEFGCNRVVPGAQQYLGDLISIFNEQKWHWAFYAFREDTWPAMDYEMGTRPLGEKYWKAVDKGEDLSRFRSDNPLSETIMREFRDGSH